MQIYICIDVTAEEQKATIAVNPYGNRASYQTEVPTGGSLDEARRANKVLDNAIMFAQTINGMA